MSKNKIIGVVIVAAIATGVAGYYYSSTVKTPQKVTQTKEELNEAALNVIETCMRSINVGLTCDTAMDQLYVKCKNENDYADACKDQRIEQYLKFRNIIP